MTRVWSFFSGAGGFDLGLESVGLAPQLAVEVDPTCCATLTANRTQLQVIEEDVCALSEGDLRNAGGAAEVDLLVGGPPCQSFSTGGGRAALNDPRGNLIFVYLRLIDQIRPRAFVLENVANLITAAIKHRPINQRPGKRWNLSSYSINDKQSEAAEEELLAPLEPEELSGSAIAYLLEVLREKLEYSISLAVLNAADYGAPQRRLRLIIIGSRDAKAPTSPELTHGPDRDHPYTTVRDAIWDLRHSPGPGSAYTEDVRKIFDLIPEGKNWRSLSPDVARAAMGERSYLAGGGKVGFFRRLAWDEPAPTITGRSNRKGSALCHPVESRPLSVHECARLQGFPDDWSFAGSAAAQYLQVGNAVPVALGAAVGAVLVRHLDGAAEVETRSVADMLAQATTCLRQAARNRRPGPATA